MRVLARSGLFLLLFLFPIIVSGQNAVPESLATLLDGSQKDPLAILADIDEQNLPLSLGVVETLKFRALHGDSPQTPESIEVFRQALIKRLSESKAVSLEKAAGCSHQVPSREISFAGQKITIPSHFRASVPLEITEFGPQDEAGSLFPDIWASFVTDSLPVRAAISLDGRSLSPIKVESGRAVFRPHLSPEDLLTIGTHTVSISLTDSANRQTSKRWSFTIGAKAVPISPAPEDARIVASFSLELSKILSGAPPGYSLTVVVRETSDGKRFYEYIVVDGTSGGSSSMRTTSLVWVCRLAAKSGLQEFLEILPKTPLAFVGNRINFSGTYLGPGQVIRMSWHIGGPEIPDTIVEGSSASVVLRRMRVGGSFSVVVTDWPGAPPEQTMTLSKNKQVSAFIIDCQFPSNRSFSPTQTGTAAAELEGLRVTNNYPTELIEGATIPIEEQGRLTVVSSKYKIVAGDAEATIENPIATVTRVLFETPGFVEIVHDLSLTFAWGSEEVYAWKYDPVHSTQPAPDSALFGNFLVRGSVEFDKLPPGIIHGSSRKVKLKKLTIQLNDEKRTFSSPDQLELLPPWVLARSILFPASSPLQLTYIIPVLAAKLGPNPISLSYFWKTFESTLAFPETKPFFPKIICQMGFIPALWRNSPILPPEYPQFPELIEIPAFRSPAELVDIEISPPDPSPLPAGQTQKFEAAFVPKPNLGEGRIDEGGGSLDLLEGYEVVSWEPPSWKAALGNDVVQTLPLAWEFPLLSQVDSGTYLINADTNLKAKEKDTDGTVDLKGTGQISVKAVPGLKITSPRQDLTYPKDFVVKVGTTIDSTTEEGLAKWKTLKWYVNETEVKPNTDAPPWDLELNKVGSWTLHVVLPDPSNPQMELASDTVTYQVKPISVTITPTRKVVASTPRQEIPLRTIVELEGNQLPKPGEYVPWGSGKWKATVKNVEWKPFTMLPGCASLEPNQNNPLEAKTIFSSPGAETVLATVTIQVEPTKPNKKNPPELFTLPAVRADLWAIPQPLWLPESLKGHLKAKSIAGIERTFWLSEGYFRFKEKPYFWSEQNGIDPEIKMDQAIPDGNPLSTKLLGMRWEGPDGQSGTGSKFSPLLKIPADVKIPLLTSLIFDPGNTVPFQDFAFDVKVEALETLINVFVDPSDFTILLGASQLVRFVTQPVVPTSLTPSPTPALSKTELHLQEGSFLLSISSVDWSLNSILQEEKTEVLPFFPNAVGMVSGLATGNFVLREILPEGVPVKAGNAEYQIERLFRAKVEDLKMVTETVATVPANRDRKKIGVGERVTLTLQTSSTSPIIWSIFGNGKLSDSTGNPVVFTAHDSASTPTIMATSGGVSCSVTFNVVEPDSVLIEQEAGTNLWHRYGQPSCGFIGRPYIQPADVSFENIDVREGAVNAVCTGYFSYSNGAPHKDGPWTPIVSVIEGKGSKVDFVDEISGRSDNHLPYVDGSFTWAIPWYFKVAPGLEKQFTIVAHVKTIDAAGTITISKGGTTKSAGLNDPDSDY